jgi:hypothetical protein
VSPVEAMARAAYEKWVEVADLEPRWIDLPGDHRLRLEHSMVAALRALRENVSEEMVDKGWDEAGLGILDPQDVMRIITAALLAAEPSDTLTEGETK